MPDLPLPRSQGHYMSQPETLPTALYGLHLSSNTKYNISHTSTSYSRPTYISTANMSGCGGNCACMGGSPSPQDTSSSTSCSTTGSSARKVCDPYGNDGKAFTDEHVEQATLVLDEGWEYDQQAKHLSRKFSFRFDLIERAQGDGNTNMYNVQTGSSDIPGHILPSYAFSCFEFAGKIGNICMNNAHWPKSIAVNPGPSNVIVTLRTHGRGGLTAADINIAVLIDGLYSGMVRAGIQRMKQ